MCRALLSVFAAGAGKGKAHKRYEFGQKVAVASTNRGSWMVAAPAFGGLPDNPHDGHSLADTLTAVQAVTDAYVDKGYRGHGCTPAVNVHLPGQRSGVGSRAERRRLAAALMRRLGFAIGMLVGVNDVAGVLGDETGDRRDDPALIRAGNQKLGRRPLAVELFGFRHGHFSLSDETNRTTRNHS